MQNLKDLIVVITHKNGAVICSRFQACFYQSKEQLAEQLQKELTDYMSNNAKEIDVASVMAYYKDSDWSPYMFAPEKWNKTNVNKFVKTACEYIK